MKPLERSIERRVCAELEAAGAVVLKIGYDGWPDRLVLMPGAWFYWIEFKRPGGKLRKVQERRIAKLRGAGHQVDVIGGDK
jgi:hypothetical protein